MSAEKLSKRYAKALFEESISKNSLEAVHQDMQLLKKSITDSRELKLFLKSPIIQQQKKFDAVEAIYGGKVSAITSNMMKLLIMNSREGYADEIADAFIDLYNDHNNITHVNVITAIPMDAEQEDLIKTAIIKKIGQTKLVIHSEVDPDILGGFIIDLGDTIFDASVRNKLSNIANELIYN